MTKKVELNEEILDTVAGGFSVDTKVKTGYEKKIKAMTPTPKPIRTALQKPTLLKNSRLKAKTFRAIPKTKTPAKALLKSVKK